jgi:hypothetical protein
MMNIPPSEAKALSLWEYEALLHNWNKAHDTGDDIAPPDPEMTQRIIDRINALPNLPKGEPVPMRAGA